jgi:hypothetical protein
MARFGGITDGFAIIAEADVPGETPGRPFVPQQISRNVGVVLQCLFQAGPGFLTLLFPVIKQ